MVSLRGDGVRLDRRESRCSPPFLNVMHGRGLAWIEQNLAPLLIGPATAIAGAVIVHTLA
jgi:hypothetical protein